MKEKREHSWLSQGKIDSTLFYLILLFLPTQLGIHFWPDFSFVLGVRIDYLSPTLYFTDVLIFILFLIVLFKREIKLVPNLYFSFFLVLLFLSSLLSKNLEVSLIALLRFIEFSFLSYFVYKKVKVDSLFLKVISVGILFESFLGIAQFLKHGSIQGIFYFFGERIYSSQTPNIANAVINGELVLRSYGTFSHPNVLAGFLLIGISFILLFAKPKVKSEKILFYLAVIAGIIGLILTLGRTAILGFIILIVFKASRSIQNKSIQGISFAFGILIFIFLALLPFSTRFTSLNLNDESVVKRQELIASSISMIKDNPLFGVGPNNFLMELPEYFEGTKKVFYLQPVHNIYLLFVSQVGLLTSLFALVFIIKLFIRANLNMKFILVLIGFLGFFDHYFLTLVQGQLLLALIIGLSFAKFPMKKI